MHEVDSYHPGLDCLGCGWFNTLCMYHCMCEIWHKIRLNRMLKYDAVCILLSKYKIQAVGT